ncbi:MAG: GNAT family N-acetyltransferase [Alphaproteobacteria bacterium]
MQNGNATQPDPSQMFKGAGEKALRRATTADVATIRDLTRAAYAKWVPFLGREPRPMNADYDAAVRNHLVDLLHVAGEVTALIEMAPSADHFLIVNIAVAPGHQGHGHGRALMAHAEEVARTLNLSEMRLYTNALFAENIRFYGRLGYRVDRKEEHAQFGVTVYMSKRLDSADAAAKDHSSSRTSP